VYWVGRRSRRPRQGREAGGGGWPGAGRDRPALADRGAIAPGWLRNDGRPSTAGWIQPAPCSAPAPSWRVAEPVLVAISAIGAVLEAAGSLAKEGRQPRRGAMFSRPKRGPRKSLISLRWCSAPSH